MSDVSQSFALLKQASGDEMTDLVREFDKRLADPTKIPRGWRPIARELKQQLAMLARDDPDRVRGTLGTSTRFPLLAADVDDSVVAGVLRRANARALCACRVCGARASNLETSLPRGYCPRHSAVYWLIGLVNWRAEGRFFDCSSSAVDGDNRVLASSVAPPRRACGVARARRPIRSGRTPAGGTVRRRGRRRPGRFRRSTFPGMAQEPGIGPRAGQATAGAK